MNPNNVAVPPPPQYTRERGRSNSNAALMSGRLRAASEMRQQGVISEDEKAQIKHMILSDPSFREQFDNARKTGDLTAIKKVLAKVPEIQDLMLSDMTDMNLGVDDLSFLDDFGADHVWAQHSQGVPPPAAMTAKPPPPGGMMPVQQHRQSVGFGAELSRLSMPTQAKGQILDPSPAGGGRPGMHPAPHPSMAPGSPGYTRKRQASRSMPAQGMHKVAAASQHGSIAMPPGDAARNGMAGPGHARRQSRPLEIHASLFRGAPGMGHGAGPGGMPGGMGTHSQQRSSEGSGIKPEGSHAAAAMNPAYAAGRGPPGGMPQQQALAHSPFGNKMSQLDSHLDGEDLYGDDGKLAKSRKNERERKRRLAVTQGFDELYKLLKRMEEDRQSSGEKDVGLSIIATSKLDKASILRNSIEKIQGLENQIRALQVENSRLRDLIACNGRS